MSFLPEACNPCYSGDGLGLYPLGNHGKELRTRSLKREEEGEVGEAQNFALKTLKRGISRNLQGIESESGSISCIQLSATPWTIACQTPLSMGFSRQEYWSGLPFLSPEDLPDLRIKPESPTMQTDSLLSEPQGKPGLWVFPNPFSENSLSGLRVLQSSWLIEISLIQKTYGKETISIILK